MPRLFSTRHNERSDSGQARSSEPKRRRLVSAIACWISSWIGVAVFSDCTGYSRNCLPPQNNWDRVSPANICAQLRGTVTMMYLEAVQKNYGTAREYSKKFIHQAQRIVSNMDDPGLRNLLRDTLMSRDQSQRIWRREMPPHFQKYSQSFPSSSRLRSIDESSPWQFCVRGAVPGA